MIRQVVVVFALGLVGCKPMYGDKPDTLRSPKPLKPKVVKEDPKAVAPPVPIYIEKCKVPASAQLVQRNRTAAQTPFDEGTKRFGQAENEPEDSPQRAVAAKESLEKFRDALVMDHFHADATLWLARSYDTFHRKACALVMLKRIGLMRLNKAFKNDADRVANSVNQHASEWFAAYESEAKDAVNP